MRKNVSIAAGIISALLLALPLLWSLGLMIYQPISILPATVYLAAVILWCCTRKKHTSSRAATIHLALWSLILVNIITYLLIPGPSPEKWQKPWSIAPEFIQEADLLTIRNLRDFRYRTEADSDARYRTETYDLNTLCGVDFAECHWDGMTAVCHTMLTFNFSDGRRFVVSAETRLPEGVGQNAIAGLYKQYGILYLFGTEEDLYGLRTNIRHEDLSIYPLRITQHGARKLLQHYIDLAIRAETSHQPYNTITANCSTGLVSGFRALVPDMARKYDFLPLHNGSIAGLLISYGAIQQKEGETEEQIRKRCYVGYDIPLENYSGEIREKITK